MGVSYLLFLPLKDWSVTVPVAGPWAFTTWWYNGNEFFIFATDCHHHVCGEFYGRVGACSVVEVGKIITTSMHWIVKGPCSSMVVKSELRNRFFKNTEVLKKIFKYIYIYSFAGFQKDEKVILTPKFSLSMSNCPGLVNRLSQLVCFLKSKRKKIL